MAAQDRWNHRSVKAQQAWDKLPKKANGDVNWGNIRVAHLDTGYTRHAAFGAWPAVLIDEPNTPAAEMVQRRLDVVDPERDVRLDGITDRSHELDVTWCAHLDLHDRERAERGSVEPRTVDQRVHRHRFTSRRGPARTSRLERSSSAFTRLPLWPSTMPKGELT